MHTTTFSALLCPRMVSRPIIPRTSEIVNTAHIRQATYSLKIVHRKYFSQHQQQLQMALLTKLQNRKLEVKHSQILNTTFRH